GVGSDAVLVPGDVPGDADDQLAADPRERNDARARRPEALRDPAHRAAVVARVEDVRSLDHLLLARRKPAEARLRNDGIVRWLPARVEERSEAAALASPLARNGRRRRTALSDPAVLERDVGAERADVNEVLTVRGEAQCALAGQECPLADRADPGRM